MTVKIESIVRKNRYAVITFNDGTRLRILPDVVYKNSIRKGDEITEEKFEKIKKQSETLKLENSALRMLSGRDHAVSELKRKLLQKNYDSALIDDVIQKLLDRSFLDDRKFACKFIDDRRSRRKDGIRKIISELQKRGVNQNFIREAVSEKENRDLELENALVLIEKKKKLLSQKSLPKKDLNQKLFNYLLGKGYEPDIIYEAVNDKYTSEI